MTGEQLKQIREDAHSLTHKQAEMAFYHLLGRLVAVAPQAFETVIADVKKFHPEEKAA